MLDFEGANPNIKNSAVRTHFQARAKIGKVKLKLLLSGAAKVVADRCGNSAQLQQLEAVLLHVF